jgi:adenosylcobinamide-GDP ribazoletransferase
VKKFLIALQFLSALPIKIRGEIKPEDFGKSLLYFPLVGALIGLVLSSVSYSLIFLPDLVNSILILLTSIFITGGMHLDGFADFCDGFSGGKTRQEILEIMRDSRTGVMGAIGITGILLLKFSLFAGISHDVLWKSLIMMATFSRWSQCLACYFSRYAREDGKAKFFIEYVTIKEVIIGGLFTIALFWLLQGLRGLILFVLAFILAFLFMNSVKKRIGGMTGDTIGATNEIAEAVVLLFFLLKIR